MDLMPTTNDQGVKKKVLVINTGGTASMKMREDGKLDTVPGYLSERIAGFEELAEARMPEVSIKEYVPLIDSSHMEPSTWLALAKDIDENYYNYDGFVIVMGTDTMAYAASAVSFILENLGKTVIFTGSQIPLSQPHTDCRRNVLVSIIIAANGHFPEVGLFFSNKLMRACRATKVNSFGLNAFDSPNCEPLMTLATGMRNSEHGLRQPRSRFRMQNELATGVVTMKLAPGFDDVALMAVVRTAEESDLKAVVLEVYGSGGAPYQKVGLMKIVEMADELGVLVVAKSQCLIGSILPDLYAANVSVGVASAGDMTTEALVTKLAYLFAKFKNYDRKSACERVRALLLESLRGEVSPSQLYTQQLLAREPISALSKL